MIQSQKNTIEQALMRAGIEFKSMEFGLNDQLILKCPANSQVLESAKAGLFDGLKPIAWRISEAVGNRGEEVDYFVSQGQAVFIVSIDLTRAESTVRQKPPKAPKTPRFAVGQQVWAKVVYKGKEVVIKTTITAVKGKAITVQSHTTKAVYPVTAEKISNYRQ